MKILLLLTCVLLAGNLFANTEKILPNMPNWSTDEYCYEGVVYLLRGHGMTIKFNRNGSVEHCTSR